VGRVEKMRGRLKKDEQHQWPPRELDGVLVLWPTALLFVSIPNHRTYRFLPFVSCKLQDAVIRYV
jgi:hypothetical protein